MTTLTLIRHGETDWNLQNRLQGRENNPLNETGISQAHRCAEHLKQFEWDILLSSPLDRTRDTAKIINRLICLDEIHIDDGLIERDFGEASGLTSEEKKAKFPDNVVPGFETRSQIVQRAHETLERIAKQFPEKRILIVTHGGVINAMLYYLSGGTIGTGITAVRNTSITRISYENGKWTLLSYDETAE